MSTFTNTHIATTAAFIRGMFAPVRPVNAIDWNQKPQAGIIALDSSEGFN